MHITTRLALFASLALTGCAETPLQPAGAPLRIETAYSFPNLGTNFVTNFDFAPDGTLWAVTFEGRIFRIRQGVVTPFDGALILGAAPVWDLFIDKLGQPWITAGSAVAFYDGSTWTRQEPPDFMGLAPKAGQIALNSAGDVMLGVGDVTAGGLMLRRNGTWQAITPQNSMLPSPTAREIEVAPDGSFWIGLAQHQGKGGLTRITNGSISAVYSAGSSGLLYNWIDDIAFATDRIWIGFSVPIYDVPAFPDGGMQSFPIDGGSPTSRFPSEAGIGSNRVASLVVGASGEVWFTTGLDEDSGCTTCVSSIGVLDTDGTYKVISHLNSDVAPNEFMPQIRRGPDGGIYVLRASQNDIVKVSR
jgi:hypothetical protein